jgi:hypothetical protein
MGELGVHFRCLTNADALPFPSPPKENSHPLFPRNAFSPRIRPILTVTFIAYFFPDPPKKNALKSVDGFVLRNEQI